MFNKLHIEILHQNNNNRDLCFASADNNFDFCNPSCHVFIIFQTSIRALFALPYVKLRLACWARKNRKILTC